MKRTRKSHQTQVSRAFFIPHHCYLYDPFVYLTCNPNTMKLSLPLIGLLTTIIFHTPVFSQSGESKIEFQKESKLAAVIELPYTSDIVEGAIKEYMEKKGTKGDRFKSFALFRNTRLDEMCDVYCKVERKIKNDRESSVVYMLIGRPGENIAVRTADDRFKVSEAKELLNKMAPSVDAYNLDVQIKKQEEQVKKAEKRLLSLKDDQYDLEKRIKALQDKLALNKNDQLVQTEELTKQKEALNIIVQKKDITMGKTSN